VHVYVVAVETGSPPGRAGGFGRGTDYDGRFSSRPGGSYRGSMVGSAGRGFDRF